MRKQFILISIIVLGIILRLFILFQRGSLWFDEAFSVHFASLDLREIWSFLKFENNPPLYFYVLHFWMSIFGNSELAVRSLSMVFGIAAIPLVYLMGVKFCSGQAGLPAEHAGATEPNGRAMGREAGLFAAFLTAISTFQVFYSTEARMYSLYLFFTLVAVWLFLQNQEIDAGLSPAAGLSPSWPRGIVLFLTLFVLIWTHITAWFIVFAMLVYLFWQSRFSFKQFYILNFKFLICVALVALSLLPWAINFIRLKIAAPLSQGYFFYLPPDRNYFLDILETFLVFGEDSAFVVTLLSVVMVILLWFAFDKRRSNLRGHGDWISPGVKFILCWLFVPLFVGFAFSNAVPRYFIAVAPALYLFLGIGFARAGDNRRSSIITRKGFVRGARWIVPLLMFSLVLPDYLSLQKIGHHEWDKLANWIENVECRMENGECRELIVINPHSEILPFERYYQGALPVVGFYPHTNDIGVGVYPREDDDSRDLRIVKTNWISINTKENVRALADVTEGYSRVFLITGEIDQTVGRNLVPVWFWENGWQRVFAQEFGRIGVMELQRMSF